MCSQGWRRRRSKNTSNSKLQHPEKLQASTSNAAPSVLIRTLDVGASLDVGAWNLELLLWESSVSQTTAWQRRSKKGIMRLLLLHRRQRPVAGADERFGGKTENLGADFLPRQVPGLVAGEDL